MVRPQCNGSVAAAVVVEGSDGGKGTWMGNMNDGERKRRDGVLRSISKRV